MAEIKQIITSRDECRNDVRNLLLEEAEAGYTEVMFVGILPTGEYRVVGKMISNLTMVGALEYAKRDVMANNTPGAV
jgi:hypothetical protein